MFGPGFSDLTPPDGGMFFAIQGTALWSYSLASNVWTELTGPGANVGGWSGPAWLGDSLYLLNDTQVFVYSIPTNTWSVPLTGIPDSGEDSNVHDNSGNVYTFAANGDILEYSTTGNAVISLPLARLFPELNEPRMVYDSCSGLLYVVPRFDGKGLDSVNPYTLAVIPLTPIPDAQINDIFCSDNAGHLYAGGAANGTQFWQYTIATNAWQQIAAPPFSVGNNGACTVGSDDNLYFTPGDNLSMARIDLH
jgi:outer membrane protein assembly factor BamB